MKSKLRASHGDPEIVKQVEQEAEEFRWQAIGNLLEFTKNFEQWFEQFKKK